MNPELLLANERLPAVLVDLDAFDRNVRKAGEFARSGGKTLRLATKSLRVPELIERALRVGGDTFRGVMCYSAEEAHFLHSRGIDDFLLAYPTLQQGDLDALREIHASGARATLVVDHPDQIRAIAKAMQGVERPFPVLVDVDVSLRILGGLLHLGVRRSPIRTAEDALELGRAIAAHPELRVSGFMAYEAQVAGLADRSPFKRLINPILHWIRKASVPRVARLRAEIARAMREQGHALSIVNGAGTGSLDFAVREPVLTEVTVGSGFLCPHLFDHYSNIRFEPACYFALQAVRSSDPGYVTCLGGGYVASGEPGWDRLPEPCHPPGLKLVAMEGAGEVQTPLRLSHASGPIRLGSAVLFRHAKAGELAERFNEYLLTSGGAVVGRARTYRGLGRCFL